MAKELEGEWKGDYEMLGYIRHVSIKFANHPDGATAEFVIVGRKHNVLPVDLVTQEGEMVTVDSHEMGFSFEGRLNLARGTCSLVIPSEVEEWSEWDERHRRLRREGSGERVGRRTSQSLDVNDATFSNSH